MPWRIIWRKYLPVLTVIFISLPTLDSDFQSASAPANWKQDWDATQRAAEKGRLIIYGPRGADQQQLYSERFQQAFPRIKVYYSAGRMSEVLSRIMAEQRAGLRQADLVLGGTDILLGTLKDKGLLQPIRPSLLLPELPADAPAIASMLSINMTTSARIMMRIALNKLVQCYIAGSHYHYPGEAA